MSFQQHFDTRESLAAAGRLIAFALAGAVLVSCIAITSARADCQPDNNGRVVCHSSPAVPSGDRIARRRHHPEPPVRRRLVDPNGSPIVRVTTAAGIEISVAASFAPKMQAFIADLVASGYKPRRIHCHARSGHVHGSLHYRGEACDFDQTGWNKTARAMYRVRAIAARHGLRDGCSFRDCGHIDSGGPLHVARRGQTQ
jgi:hypothetical protein